MRARYVSNGGQLRLCVESKTGLGLVEASQWTLDNLVAVQPQVILPLLKYWSDSYKRLSALYSLVHIQRETSLLRFRWQHFTNL